MRVNKARLSLPSFMFRPIQKAALWIMGRIKTAISGLSKRASGMPVPSSMGDLSVTESSNSPSGSDAISTGLDNYLRAIQAIVRSTNHKGADIASAASVAIGASPGEFLTVTGTTTITSFDSVSAGIVRTVQFSGALTLTHSSNIQMPGSVNYTTAAGDIAVFRSLGAGQWKCVSLQRNQDPAPAVTPEVQRLKKTSNTTRASTTVTSADPVLSGHVIQAAKSYKFKLHLVITGPSGGFKYELRDTTDRIVDLFYGETTFFDSALSTVSGTRMSYSFPFSVYPATTNDEVVLIEGFVRGHPTLDRTLDLFWAQDASSASGTSVKDGSYFEIQEI